MIVIVLIQHGNGGVMWICIYKIRGGGGTRGEVKRGG
jgi:hypothetical protein